MVDAGLAASRAQDLPYEEALLSQVASGLERRRGRSVEADRAWQ